MPPVSPVPLQCAGKPDRGVVAGKPSDDEFMRMARESVMRMADSRGDSMPGNPPADASGALNDSRSQALRSQLEVSGGQSMGAGGKVGAEFREGDRFAKRFTIRALIAQGGMGAVYRAMDENTDEVVALKTIRPDLVNSPEAVERFLAEGRVTRRLSHPGIARVFDIDRAEGRWFIAMEFVRGQTLRQWMRRKDAKGARISVKDALWAARKILDVLSYLHAQGIIHRDLKPENMIVGKADDGSGNFLKIIDFGLARSLAGNGPQLTATGAAMGTFAYMSPEQRAGKPLDQRTDIYSAAVIIYEMLTGVAYDGNWEGLGDDVPTPLQAVLRTALSKFPESRPAHADELLEALDGVLAVDNTQPRADRHDLSAFQLAPGAVAPAAPALRGHQSREHVTGSATLKAQVPTQDRPGRVMPDPSLSIPAQPPFTAVSRLVAEQYAQEAVGAAIITVACGCCLPASIICIVAGHRCLRHAKTTGHVKSAVFAMVVGYMWVALVALGLVGRILAKV